MESFPLKCVSTDATKCRAAVARERCAALFPMDALLRIFSWLPLSALHRLGAFLGVLAFWCGPSYRRKLRANLRQAGLADERVMRQAARHAGMQAVEIAWVWKRSNADVMAHTSDDESAVKAVADAVAEGKSLIFMTPHVGCYEVSPVWVYEKCLKPFGKTFTVLYREPKQKFIRKTVAAGRLREGMDPAPADLSGVRKILRAMKAGGALGCLPDQVPGRGEGVWVPFFGRPAFTMTFPMKMARQFDAALFVVWTVRHPGKGWEVHLRRWYLPEETSGVEADVEAMNREIERAILQAPEQYIWNYNRYKRPKGAKKKEPAAG